MEIFAPADISTYGAGIAPNTGWWGSWDYLRYTVSAPHRTLIGNPDIATGYNTGTPVFYGATPNTSTDGTTGGSIAGPQLAPMDTGWIGQGPSNGYRWEGGWMDKNHGFMFSAFRLYDNDQNAFSNNVGVPFYAPPQGPLGISLLQGFVDPNGTGHDADLNGNGIFGRYGPNPPSGAVPSNAGAPDFGDLAPFAGELHLAHRVRSSRSMGRGGRLRVALATGFPPRDVGSPGRCTLLPLR